MNRWESYIQAGNAHFVDKQCEAAEADYRLAMDRAKKLFDSWFDRDQAVAALVVSYQNLADLYICQKLTAKAESVLTECHEFLCNYAGRCNADEALLRGLRCSYAHLMRHVRLYGSAFGYAPKPFEQCVLTYLPDIEATENAPTC